MKLFICFKLILMSIDFFLYHKLEAQTKNISQSPGISHCYRGSYKNTMLEQKIMEKITKTKILKEKRKLR